MALFICVVASIVGPPAYAGVELIEGRYFLAAGVLLGWLLWLRIGLRLFRWVSQGIEYSSL